MNPLLIGPLMQMATGLMDRLFPNPEQAAKAKLKLLMMEQAGELKELDAALQRDLAQARVNEAEAGSSSILVAGWRPGIGWVCVAALAYQFLFRPLLPWVLAVLGQADVPPMPSLDDNLWELVFVMLGFGGLRSFEKHKGVAK